MIVPPERGVDDLEKEPGSWLPRKAVDRQVELAAVSEVDLGQRMAEVVIASALRDPGATPRGVLENMLADELLDDEAFSDETWREKLGPELRRVLAARGVELEP